jgi:hypothetical protein
MNATQTFACEFASRYESFFYDNYATASAHFDAALDTMSASTGGVVHWFPEASPAREVRRGYEPNGFRIASMVACVNGKFSISLQNLDARN